MIQRAIIFPGQGSQGVGMGRDFAAASPRAKAVFDRANDTLGFDLARVCFEGPAEELERTDLQQPAIFVTSVAIWEAFVEAGGRREAFTFAAGLSLGEYTALHVAGSVDFDDAVRLVHRRGQLMQEAARASESGMVSLIGADERAARTICERAAQGEVLVAANFNCPGQIVLSGAKAACNRAVDLAGEYGCRAVMLPVAGAFHSPLMQPAADGLGKALSESRFSPPALRVFANVSAREHQEPDQIRDALARQLISPVLWQSCIERMIQQGVTQFLEIGPGRVLTGLLRKINREVSGSNLSSADSMGTAVSTFAAAEPPAVT